MPEITEEKLKQHESNASILDTLQKMQAIIATIRVTESNLPFAIPKNEKILEIDSIELSKEGGVYVRYKDCVHARKGLAHSPSVTAVDNVKKVLISLANGFSGFRGKTILALFFFIFRKRLTQSFSALLDQLHFMVLFHRLKPEWYCKAAREAYGAIDNVKIRDIVTLILEFDDSYRFRFQDAVGELDRERFNQNPFAEIKRLLGILENREKDARLKLNWKVAQKFLFLLFFVKEIREQIMSAFSKINPVNVRLDEADFYFASLKVDGYNWGGKIKK